MTDVCCYTNNSKVIQYSSQTFFSLSSGNKFSSSNIYLKIVTMYLQNNTLIQDNIRTGFSWSSLISSDAVNVYEWTLLLLIIFVFIIPFFGPILLVMTLYMSSFIMFFESIYRAISKVTKKVDNNRGKNKVTNILYWLSYIWHGYKVVGKKNLPQDSAAVLVFYQSSLPIDVLYFTSHLWRHCHRSIFVLTHKKQYTMTGWNRLNKRLSFLPMTRKHCVYNLFNGNDIILPLEQDVETKDHEKYTVNWNGKISFATIAIAAKVPIIPIFTKNIEEAFWIPWFLKKFARGRRYPVVVGGLPVQLITYIGKPILFDETISAKELANKVANNIQSLIDQHQSIPGNKFSALLDRFWVRDEETNAKQTSFTLQCEKEGFPGLSNGFDAEAEETVFKAVWAKDKESSEFVNAQPEPNSDTEVVIENCCNNHKDENDIFTPELKVSENNSLKSKHAPCDNLNPIINGY